MGEPSREEVSRRAARAIAPMVKRCFLEAEIQGLAHELSRTRWLDEGKVEERLRDLVKLAQEAVTSDAP